MDWIRTLWKGSEKEQSVFGAEFVFNSKYLLSPFVFSSLPVRGVAAWWMMLCSRRCHGFHSIILWKLHFVCHQLFFCVIKKTLSLTVSCITDGVQLFWSYFTVNIEKKVKVEQGKGQLLQTSATEKGLWCSQVLGADSLENPWLFSLWLCPVEDSSVEVRGWLCYTPPNHFPVNSWSKNKASSRKWPSGLFHNVLISVEIEIFDFNLVFFLWFLFTYIHSLACS